jgi:arylsulfatase A-like enzyme
MTYKNHNLKKEIGRRDLLKLAGTAATAGVLNQAFPNLLNARSKNERKRPNIIYILGDNHNANTIGYAGHPFIKTPGMDRLAEEGVVFEHTYNTTSLCSPSRASILTGLYAHNHGVKNNHTPWTGKSKTFLEHLSQSGYATAFIGKWHMPGKGLPDMPFLDLFVSYTYREGQGAYFNCPMIVNGNEVPSRKPYITEEITDYAVEFMEEQVRKSEDEQKPFCIYLSHRPGHPPFQSPKDISGMYADEDVSKVLPKHADSMWYGKTKGNVFQGTMMGSYHDQYRRYCETLTAMDQDIVNLLNKIDELGLTDNTMVIYMGDNGMQWGKHDRHGIREPYEDSARLPLVVRAPWLTPDPGMRRKQLSLNIDIAPTLLDIAGIPVPREMDGQSLLPILETPGKKGRNAFLMEFWRYYPENTPSYVGVRSNRYKYIQFEKGRDPWLFDLKTDPQEMENLFGTPAGDAILPKMKQTLLELNS